MQSGLTSPVPFNILVVGECGDGKSTLINGLRDQERAPEPACGRDPEGVTKDISVYPCPDLEGVPFNLVDCPGFGSVGVPPMKLVSMIEDVLKVGKIPGGIRGVVVTTPIPDGRIKLGAQVAKAIVRLGFVAPVGANASSSVIFCGTKKDKADCEDEANFARGLDGSPSVQSLFFDGAPGLFVMVSNNKDGYRPLLDAVRRLPEAAISYARPEARVVAEALASILGTDAKELQSELEEMRKVGDMRSAEEEQMKRMREVKQQALEEERRRCEETKRQEERIDQLEREALEVQLRQLQASEAAALAEKERAMMEAQQLERQGQHLKERMKLDRRRHKEEMRRQQERHEAETSELKMLRALWSFFKQHRP